MDHFSTDLLNSPRETVRFVISLRRILTSSVRYLSRQHMVLSPQTVMVTRQTITTSVFTTHYILEGAENCLAETRSVLRLPRRSPQNGITSWPISTAANETETQTKKCASIGTQFYIFVSKCVPFPEPVIRSESPISLWYSGLRNAEPEFRQILTSQSVPAVLQTFFVLSAQSWTFRIPHYMSILLLSRKFWKISRLYFRKRGASGSITKTVSKLHLFHAAN
jgi:hypothetical protein